MVGTAQYTDSEIHFILLCAAAKTEAKEVSRVFEAKFGRELPKNKLRYVRNKYGRDPRFNNVMVNYRGNNAAILPQPNLNISTSQHSSNQGATGGQATESGNDLGDSSSEQDEDEEEEEEEESTHAGHGADVADVAPMRGPSQTNGEVSMANYDTNEISFNAQADNNFRPCGSRNDPAPTTGGQATGAFPQGLEGTGLQQSMNTSSGDVNTINDGFLCSQDVLCQNNAVIENQNATFGASGSISGQSYIAPHSCHQMAPVGNLVESSQIFWTPEEAWAVTTPNFNPYMQGQVVPFPGMPHFGYVGGAQYPVTPNVNGTGGIQENLCNDLSNITSPNVGQDVSVGVNTMLPHTSPIEQSCQGSGLVASRGINTTQQQQQLVGVVNTGIKPATGSLNPAQGRLAASAYPSPNYRMMKASGPYYQASSCFSLHGQGGNQMIMPMNESEDLNNPRASLNVGSQTTPAGSTAVDEDTYLGPESTEICDEQVAVHELCGGKLDAITPSDFSESIAQLESSSENTSWIINDVMDLNSADWA